MLDSLIRASIQHKLWVGLAVLGLIIWGGISVATLPIDAVPDITNNQVQIITISPSLGASDVERLVTFPIEQVIATIPHIQQVRSFSRFGLSVITLVFPDETDIYWARQQVSERLADVSQDIPPMAGRPQMAPVTTGLGEIYQYVLQVDSTKGKTYSLMELRTIQDWIVRRQLLGTPGLADVSSFGGHIKQYEVALDPERLRSANLTVAEVFAALEKNNQNTGGAYIERQNSAYFIRTEGLATSVEDLGQIVVSPPTAGRPVPILISDVGVVQEGHGVRYGLMTRNNDGEVVGGVVLMLKGSNSSEVIGRVKERVAVIQKTLPPGVTIEPFLDRTKLVDHAIKTVLTNLAEGALIVIFVLVLFLGSLRAGLVVASVIPLSMLFAVGLMRVFGVSGNLLSLGAIDFGLIVDGAVIIVEAIMHRLALAKQAQRLATDEMDEEVYVASSQIRSLSSFGILIILIVYLPLLALGGIEGKMFRPMAQTVAFAIAGAFFLSLTYVPMASALFLSKQTKAKASLSDKVLENWAQHYKGMVAWALGAKAAILTASLLLLIGSFWLFSTLGGEFIPTLEEGDFAVETRVLPGSSITYTSQKAQQAAALLKQEFPEVKEVVAKIGSSSIPVDPMPLEACDLIVVLNDPKTWTSAHSREELASKMSAKLDEIPGVTFGFQQPIQMRFNELISGARQDVVIKIFGEDLQHLDTYAQEVGQAIRQIPGIHDLYLERSTGLAQIVARVRRDRLAEYGLRVEDVNQAIAAGFAGAKAGQVFEKERRFDLVVRFQAGSRASLENVKQIFIPTPDGRQVPLEQVADVRLESGPSQIQRDDAKRRILVGFNVRGRDVKSVVTEVQHAIEKKVMFKPGYYITFGGQFENLETAVKRLLIAVPFALLLIFVLLYATFGSISQVALISTAIPLSAIGGIIALWLRQMPFSISAGVGFIALFGVAVLNGIVLLGYFNKLKAEGVTDLRTRILEGAAVRLRPVLMTATVASLGFLPMALATSAGAEVQKPLATVVIGGLVSSTFLTLIVLPILYYLAEGGLRIYKKEKGQDGPGKKGIGLAVFFLALFGFLGAWQVRAQTQPQFLTEQQAIAQALAQNGTIVAAQQLLAAQQAQTLVAKEPGRPNLQTSYGQYNTVNNDIIFNVNQPLAWPGYLKAVVGVAKAQAISRELQVRLAKAEVRRQVRLTCLGATYGSSVAAVLQEQDSTYALFLRAAQARLRTGEAAQLEPSTALVLAGESKARIGQARTQALIALAHLQSLIQTNNFVRLTDSALAASQTGTAPTLTDTAAIESFLLAKALAQQVQVAGSELRLAHAQNKPNLSVGYLNQSLIGNQIVRGQPRDYDIGYRFQGVNLAFTLPIWVRAQRARVVVATANERAAQAAYKRILAELAGRLRGFSAEHAEYLRRLGFYQKTALPEATRILTLAKKAYLAGENNFTEYLLHVERVFRIRQDYLELVRQHNLTLIEMEYLTTPAQ